MQTNFLLIREQIFAFLNVQSMHYTYPQPHISRHYRWNLGYIRRPECAGGQRRRSEHSSRRSSPHTGDQLEKGRNTWELYPGLHTLYSFQTWLFSWTRHHCSMHLILYLLIVKRTFAIQDIPYNVGSENLSEIRCVSTENNVPEVGNKASEAVCTELVPQIYKNITLPPKHCNVI